MFTNIVTETNKTAPDVNCDTEVKSIIPMGETLDEAVTRNLRNLIRREGKRKVFKRYQPFSKLEKRRREYVIRANRAKLAGKVEEEEGVIEKDNEEPYVQELDEDDRKVDGDGYSYIVRHFDEYVEMMQRMKYKKRLRELDILYGDRAKDSESDGDSDNYHNSDDENYKSE